MWNPGRTYLVSAVVAQAVLIVAGLISTAVPFLWFMAQTPLQLALQLVTLGLFAISLLFKSWWRRTTWVGMGGVAVLLVLTLTRGFFSIWVLVGLALTAVPAVLAFLALDEDRVGRLNHADADGPLTKEVHQERKRAAKEQQRAAKQQAREEQAAEQAEMQRLAGPSVVKQMVGLTMVEIFRNGYVKVGFGGLEKLLAISGDADLSKKTGVGRAAGAVLTGGLNLAGSNIRGDIYLTIVTDKKTHSIHVDSPNQSMVGAMRKLVATGEAILRTEETAEKESGKSSSPGVDLAAQLAQLTQLHGSGALTDEQFETAKNKLLGGA